MKRVIFNKEQGGGGGGGGGGAVVSGHLLKSLISVICHKLLYTRGHVHIHVATHNVESIYPVVFDR
jgi:hypothetical protein